MSRPEERPAQFAHEKHSPARRFQQNTQCELEVLEQNYSSQRPSLRAFGRHWRPDSGIQTSPTDGEALQSLQSSVSRKQKVHRQANQEHQISTHLAQADTIGQTSLRGDYQELNYKRIKALA